MGYPAATRPRRWQSQPDIGSLTYSGDASSTAYSPDICSRVVIGKLHVAVGEAEGIVATKILNSVAARLLGEFRRTALALRAYKGRVPGGARQARTKVYKKAQ